MWVVKIGGSLAAAETLPLWLDVLSCYGGGEVAIVPGGGPFAELVRKSQDFWHFDDSVAHFMALLAMTQYGLMMAGMRRDLVPVESAEELRQVHARAGVPVWLPTSMVSEDGEVEHSWDVSSDSLAAWLARSLDASRLILVKSVAVEESSVCAEELAERGIVDAAFPYYQGLGNFHTSILTQNQYESIPKMLAGCASLGTQVIGERKTMRQAPRSGYPAG